MQRPTFFARRAILILVIVFFFVPFAVRGARLALQGMKNDVKDWLPKELAETKDLDEFRRYFLNEQFVLVSWDGCFGDEADNRYRLFLAKLTPETPPSVLAKEQTAREAESTANGNSGFVSARSDGLQNESDADQSPVNPVRYLHPEDNFIGDRLGLYFAGDWYQNWGQKGEKWLKGRQLNAGGTNAECWYYLTPDGDLFRWNDIDAPMAALVRLFTRALGNKDIRGTLVYAFGPLDGAWYHDDPRRLRAQLFKTVTTGPDVLESLTRRGGELDATGELDGDANQKEAEQRLDGTLFGPPDPQTGKKTTCIVLTLTDPARQNLHLVCGRGLLGKPRGRLFEIAEESNIGESELRLGGPPVDNVAIDEEGSITLVRLVSYSALLGVILSYLCFRSISATIIVLFVGGISALMSLGLVWWCGSSLDAITLSMPSLVYVLGLSGAAHLMNYYYSAVEENGHRGAPEQALAHGWKPAVLCNMTTAIGLFALVTSELVPIRKFGIFSGLGVLATLTVLFTYLPSALEIWPQQPRKKPARDDASWLERALAGFWQRLGGWIIDHHGLVAVGCTLIIAAFGYGLVHMRTSVNLLRMFHRDAKIIKDYAWLEQHLGPLVPMEVVVRVPAVEQRPSTPQLRAFQEELASPYVTTDRRAEIEKTIHKSQFQLSFLERMELAARIENLIEEEFGSTGRNVVGRAISAATFVRPLPEAGGSTSTHLKRTTTSSRLQAHREEFLHSDYLRIVERDQTELWRVSLRVAATQGVDYGAFVSQLQQTVEPVIAAQRQRASVLRQIDERRRQQGGQNGALAGMRVLLVGMPEGVLTPKTIDKQLNDAPSISDRPLQTLATPVDQHRIFARTLYDLLTNARLRMDAASANAPLPAKIADNLSSYDCVVIVGEAPASELAKIREVNATIIDARGHTFAPGTEQQTAWQSNPASVAAVYTGVVPIVYKAQRMLLDSLIQSTFWSVIMITPLLMWIARSIAAGTVAMLPNVLPIMMVFGGMGWLGIDVDVGSMMTASIALGVAVDDTIHYLNWFREELDRLGDRKQAILAAYKHCATPTLQAAFISGLGLSIFALSTFTPTQRFGVLMLVILWLGAVAELIYFPALLAGPLGMVFKPRKKPDAVDADELLDDSQTRQPQLQVVCHDDAADDEELSVVGADAGHILSAPHSDAAQRQTIAPRRAPSARLNADQ
jgi:uncharacterized protein